MYSSRAGRYQSSILFVLIISSLGSRGEVQKKKQKKRQFAETFPGPKMRKMFSRLKERKKGSVAGLLRWGKSGPDRTTDWGVEVIIRK